MTFTFENDNDVIVYALEKVISYARRTQQIFVAQCVWWLASVIGLEPGVVIYIDNLHGRTTVKETKNYRDSPPVQEARIPSPAKTEEERCDKILTECEQYLQESGRLQDIAIRKSEGTTRTGRINPTRVSKKFLNKATRGECRISKSVIDKGHRLSKTAGIDEVKIQRRKAEGECLRCAWPSDRKGTHRVKDCKRPINLEKGTASFPKPKEYQRLKQSQQQPLTEEDSSDNTNSETSSDDIL